MPSLRYLLLTAVLTATTLFSADLKQRTATERLGDSHLAAVHEARMKWSRDRVVLPPLGLYNDYRAVMHVHAEDAPHTLGKRDQVLAAAKESGVQIVLWTDHRGPKEDTWHGMRDGVLFIPGSEDGDNKLRFPAPGDDLLFLSHLEEIPDKSSDGFAGMEIYNRHADAKANEEMTALVKKAAGDTHTLKVLSDKMKQYPDEVFAAGTGPLEIYLKRWDTELQKKPFAGIAANDAHQNIVLGKFTLDPYAVAFRNVSTHILAQDMTEPSIRRSLREGRVYVSHDWLCEPGGFTFAAINNLGLFEIGDHAHLVNNTRLVARFPVAAHAKLIHDGKVVAENNGKDLTFKATEEGAYRVEAYLEADGEERPWIFSNAIYLAKPPASAMQLPPPGLAPGVELVRDIPYTEGAPADENKHKLDLYLPKGKTNFPVMVFIHGGSWRSGDRSMYTGLGNRFAKDGIGVVIPSYRLSPKDKPPAQIEDTAAAFAWVAKHIAERGGDPKRIYIVGHSAGGHLVSELALDPKWLAKHELKPSAIAGVASLSGVYDVTVSDVFGPDAPSRKVYSPMEYVVRGAPKFVVTYCQNDYPGLAGQAKAFHAALRKAFVESTLVYVPNESHISEIVNVWKEDDLTARAVLRLISP